MFKSSLTVTALVLSGCLLLMPFLGEPPFRFGYYMQVEAMIGAFWLMGGLAGLWTVWLCHKKPLLAQKIWQLPVVWGWLPIIILSMIASLFNAIPLQVWTGFGQLGEGTLTFLAHMFFMFVLCVVGRMPRFQNLLLWGTFLSGAVVCALTIIGCSESPFPSMRYWAWAPIFFPDFIAYIAAAFIGLYLAFFRKFRTSVLFHTVFLSSIALISYYSSNKSIGYAMVIALILMAALEVKVFSNWRYPYKFACAFLLTIVSLTVFIVFYDFFSPFLPKALSNQATITGRTYLTRLTFIEHLNQPFSWQSLLTLLFGKGWGEYGNALLGNVFLLKDIHLFSGDNWQPSWEFTERDLLHSHNTLMEHFLALGLVGVGVYLWIKYRIASSLVWQKRYAAVGFLTVTGIISIFWFPIIHTFPYLMVAHALIFSKRYSMPCITLRHLQLFSRIVAPCMIIFALIHTSFIWIQGTHAYLDPEGDMVEKIEEFSNSPANHYDALVGGRRWVAFVRSYTHNIHRFLEKEPEADVALFAGQSRKMARDLYTHIPHKGNYYSMLLPMNIYGELATRPRTRSWFEENPDLLEEWNDMAQEFIRYLPYRTDILVPYLNYLSQHHHGEKVNEVTDLIYAVNPRDPVALWFKGTWSLMNGERTSGICFLKKAIQEKIVRYIPLPEQEVSRIMDTPVVCTVKSLPTD